MSHRVLREAVLAKLALYRREVFLLLKVLGLKAENTRLKAIIFLYERRAEFFHVRYAVAVWWWEWWHDDFEF